MKTAKSTRKTKKAPKSPFERAREILLEAAKRPVPYHRRFDAPRSPRQRAEASTGSLASFEAELPGATELLRGEYVIRGIR